MTPARAVPLGAGVIAALVAVAALDALPVGVFQDDGMYVILAKALATGQGYRFIHLPDAPPGVHFPPGYPLFLAVLWKLGPAFPQTVVVFKAANAALLAAAAALTAHFAAARLAWPPAAAVAVGLLGAVTVPPLTVGGMVMSEPLFLAGLLAILHVAERRVADPAAAAPWRDAAALGLACGALALVRTLGLLAAPAIAVAYARRRQWAPAVVVCAAAAAAALPWHLWAGAQEAAVFDTLRGKYGGYTSWVLDAWRAHGPGFVVRSAGHTLHELALLAGTQFSPGRAEPVRVVAATIVAAALAVGAAWTARRAPVTAAFLALYGAVVLVWPFQPYRFVWGVWPLVMVLLGAAVAWVHARPSRAGRVAGLVALGVIALGHAGYTVRGVRGGYWSNFPRRMARLAEPALDWVRANTTPQAVIATDLEVMTYLYTGRRAVAATVAPAAEYLYPLTADTVTAALAAVLARYRPDVVLAATPPTTIAADRLWRSEPPRLALVDTLPGGGAVFLPTVTR